jgi:hypothetical protein
LTAGQTAAKPKSDPENKPSFKSKEQKRLEAEQRQARSKK